MTQKGAVSERPYKIKRLRTFAKAKVRRVWSTVASNGNLEGAIEAAKHFAISPDGHRFAVFKDRRMVAGPFGGAL